MALTEREVVNFTPSGKPVTHGGVGTAYANYGCRCEPCTDANTARVTRRSRERTPDQIEDKRAHGRPSTYSNWNCRCDKCKAAYAEKNRAEYRARKQRATA